jgi:hypothetical protein
MILKVLTIFFLATAFSTSSFALKRDPSKLYKKIFNEYVQSEKLTIADTISSQPVNTVVLKALDKSGNTIGYIREIATTTGCNSACLPILVTLFYTPDKKFHTVKSRQGLTKKDHMPFTELDYQSLELVFAQNPKIFKQVSHPKLMVDAITSETLKEFKPYVVEKAAYTSLRLNLYNQDTLGFLMSLK